MKSHYLICFLFIIVGLGYAPRTNAQENPTIEELHRFFNDQNLLITYREGEAVYGTYYFIEVHYCANGYYGLYGHTVKRTVMGNEQKSNWQEFGQWKVINRNGENGIFYAATNGKQQFYPLYKLPNGDIFIKEGVTIVNQGKAICQ